MALDIKKFISRFIEEARDHLGRLTQGLADLEQGIDTEQINSLFRPAHTLKGSSRMLKLDPITLVAHSLEDLSSALRDKRLDSSAEVSALLYLAVDTLTDQVEALKHKIDVAKSNDAQLAVWKKLSALAENPDLLNTPVTPATTSPTVVSEAKAEQDKPALKSTDTVRIKLSKLEELIKLMGELVSNHAGMRELATSARQLEKTAESKPNSHLEMQQFSRNIRETVLAQEDLMQELHDKALQMRMLPLGIVLDSASRLVRDMARSLDKQVECRIQGSEIELDRQMIDQLADPMIHLLRNALDHGIETPAIRQQKGKPAQGLLQISARQDGGWVVLEVRDDGMGLSLSAIRDKALKKGLVCSEQLAEMSQQQISYLIFEPGFSTSNMITEFSGRGVGMDVVKRSIVDDLQGVISLHSRADEGTCFTLRLPLSLAMMRVLLVRAGEQVLGFTAQYVTELISVDPDALISVADRNAVIIRNEFVPVIQLVDLLKLPQESAPKRSLSRTR